MKKIVFSIFALAAVVTGCSKSEMVDSPNFETPITFDAYSGRVPVTKATSVDDAEELAQFNLIAYNTTNGTPDYTKKHIANRVLEYSNSTWSFVAADGAPSAYYWPTDDSALKFIAWSNNAGETNPVFTLADDTSAPKLNITIPAAVADQKDVMVAQSVQQAAGTTNTNVALNFKHVLSRVHFALTSSRPVTVSSVLLKGAFHSKGTVDLTSNSPAVTVTDPADVIQYSFLTAEFKHGGNSATLPIDNTANVEDDHYLMIFPEEPTSIEITYKFDDEDKTYTAKATLDNDFTFTAGTSFKFALTLTSNAIGFDVTVDDWDPATGDDDYSTLTETVIEDFTISMN